MDYSGLGSNRRQYWRSVFAAYGAAWLWVCLFSVLTVISNGFSISWEKPEPQLGVLYTALSSFPTVSSYFAAHPGAFLMSVLVFAPFVEEALFRMLPLSFALVVGSYLENKHEIHAKNFVTAMVMVVCTLIFGLMHGGIINIFVQGVVGYFLGRLYLRHAHKQRNAYLGCVCMHAMYNFTAFAIMVMTH